MRYADLIDILALIIAVFDTVGIITGRSGTYDSSITVKERDVHLIQFKAAVGISAVLRTVVDNVDVLVGAVLGIGKLFSIIRFSVCLIGTSVGCFCAICNHAVGCSCTGRGVVIAQLILYLLCDTSVIGRTIIEDHIRIGVGIIVGRRLEPIDGLAVIIDITSLSRNTRPCCVFTVHTAVVVRINAVGIGGVLPVVGIGEVDVIEIGLIGRRFDGGVAFGSRSLCHGRTVVDSKSSTAVIVKRFSAVNGCCTVKELYRLCIFRQADKIRVIFCTLAGNSRTVEFGIFQADTVTANNSI